MKNKENTRNLLIKHYETYPKLQIQDIFKFLYQSTFGCEHFISSLETVTDYIQKEYESIPLESQPVVEQLDGAYCRVYLSYLNSGLSANTLGSLFFLSAKKEENGKQALLQKLTIAKGLVCENLLPFSITDFEQAVKDWEAKGYPSVHHSNVFREAYRPSYRVIAKEYLPFLPFFAELDKRLAKGPLKVAIEGGSASGKTTLSQLLANIYDCTVFHMDDFFLRPEQRTPQRYAEVGGNIDRERFLTEVLQPLNKGEMVNYRRFDCSSMQLEEAIPMAPKKLTVIEGAYSMHPDLATYYDFSVFLDISPELQKERILRRNSPAFAKNFFEKWIPLEKTYFSKGKIQEQCNMKIFI